MSCQFCGGAVAAVTGVCLRCGRPQPGHVESASREDDGLGQAPQIVQVQMERNARAGMENSIAASVFGIFSLLEGLVALLLSFFPAVGIIALAPAALGVVFGAIGWKFGAKHGAGRRLSAAGVVMSAIALVWVVLWVLVIVGAVKSGIESAPSSIERVVNQPDAVVTVRPRRRSASDPSGPAPSPTTGPRRSPRIVTSSPGDPFGTPNGGSSQKVFELQGEIAKLARGAAGRSQDSVWGDVDALRERIDELPETTQMQLHESLDRVIVSVVEAQLNKHYAKILERFNSDDLSGAKRECEAALDLMDSPDIPMTRTPQDSAVLAGIQALAARIEMGANPETRFQITGFSSMGGEDAASMRDLMTDTRVTAREGTEIGPYRVEAVSKDDGSVTLTDGSRTFTVKR